MEKRINSEAYASMKLHEQVRRGFAAVPGPIEAEPHERGDLEQEFGSRESLADVAHAHGRKRCAPAGVTVMVAPAPAHGHQRAPAHA